MEILRVPLLNANEDEVEVVEVAVADGDEIRKGDLICVVESTKATFDVEASQDGFLRKLSIDTGQRLPVGALIAVITESADEAIDLPDEKTSSTTEGSTRATKKAQQLADEHGIDLEALGLGGLIKARDIRRLIESGDAPVDSGVAKAKPAAKKVPLAPTAGEQRVVIFGAGGHARVLIDLIRQGRPDMHIVGLIDDSPSPPDDVLGFPVLGDSSLLSELRNAGVDQAVLGVGAVTNNALRIELYDKLREHDFSIPNLIHPDASVEPSVRMGTGNQIFAGAVVGSAAELGENTIVNSNVVVSHDCRIGSHTHLTPAAILAGGVTIGENTVVGMGVTIYLGLTVGRDAVIANGMNIMRDVENGSIVRATRD